MSAPCALAAVLLLASGGCRTAYCAAREQLGSEKRDLLRRDVDRMKDQQPKFLGTLDAGA